MRVRGFNYLIVMVLASTIILVSQETKSTVKHSAVALKQAPAVVRA